MEDLLPVAKHVMALKEELRVSKLQEETLGQSYKQLEMELTTIRMKEQADRVEISALMLQAANLQRMIDNLNAERNMGEGVGGGFLLL